MPDFTQNDQAEFDLSDYNCTAHLDGEAEYYGLAPYEIADIRSRLGSYATEYLENRLAIGKQQADHLLNLHQNTMQWAIPWQAPIDIYPTPRF